MHSNTKKIIFNKSTLIGLKAELLRKQEEIQQRKATHAADLKNFKPAPAPKKDSGKAKSLITEIKDVDPDEIETNKKVREKLEKKTRLYKSLTEDPDASKYSSNYLVQFDKKEKDIEVKKNAKEVDGDIGPVPCEKEIDDVREDEWVEFTDFLGRSRKCHVSELNDFKRRDSEKKEELQGGERFFEVLEETKKTPVPEHVEKTMEHLEKMQKKWEEEEQQLKEKDGDIHYQDLLFDDARQHGVGYYNFSTDEAMRRKEQAELEKIRKETEAAQSDTAKKRAEIEATRAERVKAARARRRARLGLPPEEAEREDLTLSILDFIIEQKKVSAAKAKEKEDRLREEREEIRKKERENYVREWDVGKEMEDGPKDKGFRILTQEEYVQQERDKRIKEFAPPRNLNQDPCEKKNEPKPNQKTWNEVRSTISEPFEVYIPEQTGLYFSSKNITRKPTAEEIYAPLINELDDDSDMYIVNKVQNVKTKTVGAEIPPPALFEYYTPEAKRQKPMPSTSGMNDAFEQGLKVLEEKNEKKKKEHEVGFLF